MGGDPVAERVVADLRPATVLVVGLDDGGLIAALRRRGVDVSGPDGDGAEVSARYDLVICLDALERLAPETADSAVTALCARTDDILFSSNPEAFDDPARVNVQPPEHWARSFAGQGFIRDLDYDAGFLGPWAVRLRRSHDRLEGVVGVYERALTRLARENRGRTALALRQEEELTRMRRTTPSEEQRRLNDEVARLSAELEHTERALLAEQRARRALADELEGIREGATYRLADRVHHGLRRAMPHGSRRGALLASGVRSVLTVSEQGPAAFMRTARGRLAGRAPVTVSPAPDHSATLRAEYQTWLRDQMPDRLRLELMRRVSDGWSHRPLVSIVMPVYNTRVDILNEAIDSVELQAYTNWELCIADDASTDPMVHRTLRERAAADDRIRLTLCSEHRGIAGTSNAALELATGELVTLLDHDDALRRHALYAVVELLQERRDVGVVYTDEDKLLLDDELGEPFFKPAWSPDMLLSTNYLCHLTVMRRELVTAVGGFRADFDGSQDHDLFLRVTELAEERGLRVTHLPRMLYIWRQMAGSAALSDEAKPEAYVAGRRAVSEALQRRGLDGTVSPGPSPGWYHVRYAIRGRPSVAIVIPTRDRVELLRECISSIESRTTYPSYSVLIIDNGSRDPETLSYLEGSPHRVVRDPGHFNYSRIMNAAIAQVDAEHVLLLNNDVSVITPDWLEAMLEHSQRPDVGAVGCRLLYPDGRPQHEGIGVGLRGPAVNLDLSQQGPPIGPMGRAIREVTAVTGACMMMRRAVYRDLGGLDEALRVACNDVDLCLRLRARGYRIIYTPLAELYHHEGASRGKLHPDEDDIRFAMRYGHYSRVRDPFVNPHVAWLTPLMLRAD